MQKEMELEEKQLAQDEGQAGQEQARLERKISATRMLLSKSKDNTTSSLNDLKVIENQIELGFDYYFNGECDTVYFAFSYPFGYDES